MMIDKKKQDVMDAISRLYSDTTVSQEQTFDALHEIAQECAERCDALEDVEDGLTVTRS